MKARILERVPAAPEFPCIMINSECLVVMFFTDSRGVVLVPDKADSAPTAYHSNKWDMGDFMLFGGIIELEND